MDVLRRWKLQDPAAVLSRVLLTAVMAMVAVAEEVVAALGELLEAMVVVVGLSAVEAEAVDPEEGLGTSEVAAAEEATAHATIVVKEATLPEIVLTNQQVMPGRAVAVVAVVVEVRATATTVASLGILQGTAPQQPVPRRWKRFSIHSKRRRGSSSFRAEAVVHGSGWAGMGFGANSSPSSLCKDRVEKP
jgi:hypothetical protein